MLFLASMVAILLSAQRNKTCVFPLQISTWLGIDCCQFRIAEAGCAFLSKNTLSAAPSTTKHVAAYGIVSGEHWQIKFLEPRDAPERRSRERAWSQQGE